MQVQDFSSFCRLLGALLNVRYLHSVCLRSKPKMRVARSWNCQTRSASSSQLLEKAKNIIPDTSSQKEPPMSSHLRRIMRKMPHSVVVATSTAPSPNPDTPPSFKGMTVSSFTTLTLTPLPIVTFNIRKPSQTLTAISKSKQFLIHILSATPSGASVADAFTKGNRTGSNVFLNPAFSVLRRKSERMEQSNDPPLLSADGITQILRCELLGDKGLIEVGDHVLVLGKVLGIIESSAEKKLHDTERRGLCYLDQAYREVGPIIEVPNRDDSE